MFHVLKGDLIHSIKKYRKQHIWEVGTNKCSEINVGLRLWNFLLYKQLGQI